MEKQDKVTEKDEPKQLYSHAFDVDKAATASSFDALLHKSDDLQQKAANHIAKRDHYFYMTHHETGVVGNKQEWKKKYDFHDRKSAELLVDGVTPKRSHFKTIFHDLNKDFVKNNPNRPMGSRVDDYNNPNTLQQHLSMVARDHSTGGPDRVKAYREGLFMGQKPHPLVHHQDKIVSHSKFSSPEHQEAAAAHRVAMDAHLEGHKEADKASKHADKLSAHVKNTTEKAMSDTKAIDLLKSFNKGYDEKAYLGELKIGAGGAQFSGSGTRAAGSKVGEMREKPGTPPPNPIGTPPPRAAMPGRPEMQAAAKAVPIPPPMGKGVFRGGDPEEIEEKKEEKEKEMDKMDKSVLSTESEESLDYPINKAFEGLCKYCETPPPALQEVNKALTSRSVPRLPRALAHEIVRRNAQNVMTRGNSRFAGQVDTSPLRGEILPEGLTPQEADATRKLQLERVPMMKACDGCGRTYTLFKGVDSGCPTCSVSKSQNCRACGKFLIKSHGGSLVCPLCG